MTTTRWDERAAIDRRPPAGGAASASASLPVLFGGTYGSTGVVAEAIAAELARRVALAPLVSDVGRDGLTYLRANARRDAPEGVPIAVVGTSTWDVGGLPADWEALRRDMSGLDLRGRAVAVFGLGDQDAYPDTFADGLGLLAELLESRGATLVAPWPSSGYRHAASRAQRGDRFVGLVLDEDNEPDRTPARIAAWCASLARRPTRAP